MISNCQHDENGNLSGGSAGDQTGKEWKVVKWYSRPWTHVLRYPNSKVRSDLAKLARAAAENDKIGYDQHQRKTFWKQLKAAGYDPSKITTKCEADCSAGAAAIIKATGYRLSIEALQNVSEDMTSRNTIAQLQNAGFNVLTDSKYLTSQDYLLPGDVLLYESHHVAINLDAGSKSASENKTGSVAKTTEGVTIKAEGTNVKAEYTVKITADSMTYDVTKAVLKLSHQDNDGEIAQKATIVLANVKVNDKKLSDIFSVRDRVLIKASFNGTSDEVFRGFIWTRQNASQTEKELTLTCYDNLIYFMKSEEYKYFSSGYSTKKICKSICDDWGIKLEYSYDSITHKKMPLRGNLADIFLTDILEEVRKKTGARPVMISKKDVIYISRTGTNTTVYKLTDGSGGNTMGTASTVTMDDMVTKVIILGKEDKNDRAKISSTVKGDTKTYGTLQKILTDSSSTDEKDTKKEANQIIKDKGKPKITYEIRAVNIPWIRKGDKITVDAGSISRDLIVLGITHEADQHEMKIEARRI